MATETVDLALSLLRVDGGTQPRALISPRTVDEYAEAMQEGAAFPALTVYFDGANYWLSDGFHRHGAALQLGFKTFACDVHQGTQRDAILHSVGANSLHGVRRTNDDKRRAVCTLLRDEEWGKWSNVEIANRCGASEFLVRELRPIFDKIEDSTRKVKRGDTTYTQRTGKIGKAQPAAGKPIPGHEHLPFRSFPVTPPKPKPRQAVAPAAAEPAPAQPQPAAAMPDAAPELWTWQTDAADEYAALRELVVRVVQDSGDVIQGNELGAAWMERARLIIFGEE